MDETEEIIAREERVQEIIKFKIRKLYKEYTKATKNIYHKKMLVIINFSVAIIAIICGLLLYWLEKNNLLGKVGSIILSSIASIIGSIVLIISISKEYIKKPKNDFKDFEVSSNIS
ncbi:1741_t:CDS:1, partial [Cetraspora pellucida]